MKTLTERFWEKVNRVDGEGCWLWTSTRNRRGYGRFHVGKHKHVYAHRYSVELSGRVIPEGFEVDHLCSNPPCARPDHLDVVSHQENVRRGQGWSGSKARQTHCLRGHEFDAKNTRIEASGRRQCRSCAALRQRASRRAAESVVVRIEKL